MLILTHAFILDLASQRLMTANCQWRFVHLANSHQLPVAIRWRNAFLSQPFVSRVLSCVVRAFSSFCFPAFPSVCANSSEERKAQFDEHKRVHPDCLVASHNDRPNGSASRPDAICKVWGDFVDAHPHHPQCNLNLTLVSSPKYLVSMLYCFLPSSS